MKRQSAALFAAIAITSAQAQTVAEFQYSYTSACVKEQGSIRGRKDPYRYCGCAYDALAENITLKEFGELEILRKNPSSTRPKMREEEKFRAAIANCNTTYPTWSD